MQTAPSIPAPLLSGPTTPPERRAATIATMTQLAASAAPLTRELYTQKTLRVLSTPHRFP